MWLPILKNQVFVLEDTISCRNIDILESPHIALLPRHLSLKVFPVTQLPYAAYQAQRLPLICPVWHLEGDLVLIGHLTLIWDFYPILSKILHVLVFQFLQPFNNGLVFLRSVIVMTVTLAQLNCHCLQIVVVLVKSMAFLCEASGDRWFLENALNPRKIHLRFV